MANRLKSTTSSAFVFSISEEDTNSDLKGTRRQALQKTRERNINNPRRQPVSYKRNQRRNISYSNTDNELHDSSMKVNVNRKKPVEYYSLEVHTDSI